MKVSITFDKVTPELVDFLATFLPATTTGQKTKNSHKHYNVPYKCGTKEYQRAIRLCKKHSVYSYAEVLLKLDNKPKTVTVKSENNVHWKTVLKNSVNPPHKPVTEG